MSANIKEQLKELYKLEKKKQNEETPLSMEEVTKYEYLRTYLDEKATVLWDEFQKETIIQRYFQAKKWGDIADDMGVVSEDHVRKASERGIAKIQERVDYEKKEKEIEKQIEKFVKRKEDKTMINEIKTTDLKDCENYSIKLGFTDTEFEEYGKASQLFINSKDKEILLIAERGVSA